MRIGRTAVVALSLLLPTFCGCATKTSTTHLWAAEDYRGGTMGNVIVFGRGMAEAQRRSLEDQLGDALADHGVAATPSYRVFPVLPDVDEARAEVTKQNFDGAVVVTLHGTRERQSYVPGHYMGGGFWGGYYGMGWGWSPGYVVTDELVDAETSVWDLRTDNGRLVWSALTNTENPTSGPDLTKSLAKEILPKMEKAGLVPKKD
jgi:hypothetical protein